MNSILLFVCDLRSSLIDVFIRGRSGNIIVKYRMSIGNSYIRKVFTIPKRIPKSHKNMNNR